MKFIISPTFRRDVKKLFEESALIEIYTHLALTPDAGDLIPQSGGARKLRWALPGRGKRDGARVIYYHRTAAGEILLLRAYAKNEKKDLSHREIHILKREIK